MNIQRLAPLLGLLMVTLVAAEEKKEEGFAPLFNGKDLTGWVPVNAAPGTFFVKEEMLITTGVPTGLLRTARRYENFILELEWMHVQPKGNSGIFVWADPLPAIGSPFTRAIEVQVLDGLETKNYTSHGDVFAIWGAKFTPDRAHPSGWMRCLPSEKRSKPAGQWNHYRIECNNGSIKLAVNGKVVSGGTRTTPRFGYICLEAEGSECRYRNLKIKELPSTRPTAAETCPEAKGHTTLFTGLDLSGWKADDEAKKAWKAEGGPNVLRFTGKEARPIWTNGDHGDYELMIDVKVPRETRVTLRPRGPSGPGVVLAVPKEQVGKWARFTVTVKKNRVEVSRGDKAESGAAIESGARGPIGLEADGPADFANLFLRELK